MRLGSDLRVLVVILTRATSLELGDGTVASPAGVSSGILEAAVPEEMIL